MIKITKPLTQKQISNLKAGDRVSLTGVIYTARDQAHKRLCDLLAKGRDEFTLPLLKNGLAAMIGKGNRCREVLQAIKKYRGVYFITYAGCGALLSKYVCKAKVIAFPDLRPEAIRRLEVKDFPLIVAIDCKGENIFPRI
ncbi:MAG: fumarate hydratase C-terminal domain-containing protein [Candidatus Omnitrophica bacterium]|nr:fumarate hydratase C-terminal domain-containing protein [Candidatus Omnitrophota bacterium]